MSDESAISNVNELMSVSAPFNATQYIRDILSAVKLGEVNPLKAMTITKRFQKISEELQKDKEFKKLALDELEKHLSGSAKSVELYSAKICKTATYTAYKFDDCGHPILNELYVIEVKVKEAIKRYEEELKLLIPNDFAKPNSELELGIPGDQKEIIVDRMPTFGWVANEDQVTVKAPEKIQSIGLKFMKI